MENLTKEEVEKIASSKQYKYKLEFPIEFDSLEPITQLTLKRFKGRHLKQIKNEEDEMERLFIMIASSSGLTPDVIEECDAFDLAVLGEICSVFMSASPTKKTVGK